MKIQQQRFEGFLKTPFLWKGVLDNLQQFSIPLFQEKTASPFDLSNTVRLGSYVEQLVFYQLENTENVQILAKNEQIIENKNTLGEIDCLLKYNEVPIHIEIAYKFYLYDDEVGGNFLEKWIGPNKRDSLVLKLNKVKEKQFPLLCHKACVPLLKKLNLAPLEIKQQAYFKAQLFVPYQKEIQLKQINSECVSGFYLRLKEFKSFIDCKFYIPKKLDWLITPYINVDWMDFKSTKSNILEFFKKQFSPLLWMKFPNGEIKKIFVVWW